MIDWNLADSSVMLPSRSSYRSSHTIINLYLSFWTFYKSAKTKLVIIAGYNTSKVNLIQKLQKIGFSINICKYNISEYEELQNLESRPDYKDIIIEATKNVWGYIKI